MTPTPVVTSFDRTYHYSEDSNPRKFVSDCLDNRTYDISLKGRNPPIYSTRVSSDG